MLYDEVYDASPNSLTTVTYVDGELASTVRVHVVADKEGVSPARDVFPDVVTPHLRARRVIIDPSRLAARADVARRFPELPYFALRPPWMAAHHFNADYIVLCSASGHEAYYRRVYQFHTWSGLRSYPMVTAKVICMGLDFGAEMERVEFPISLVPVNAGRTRSAFRRVLVVARPIRGHPREGSGASGRAAGKCMMARA